MAPEHSELQDDVLPGTRLKLLVLAWPERSAVLVDDQPSFVVRRSQDDRRSAGRHSRLKCLGGGNTSLSRVRFQHDGPQVYFLQPELKLAMRLPVASADDQDAPGRLRDVLPETTPDWIVSDRTGVS